MSALSSDVSTLGSFSQFSIEEYLGEFAPTPQRSSSDTERSNDAEGCEAHAASSITSAARSVNLRKSLPPQIVVPRHSLASAYAKPAEVVKAFSLLHHLLTL